jgi:predicted GIY-YIG superfamily endonuclease
MWYFYIVRCSDNSLYCGISNDLVKRIEKHNSGKGAKYTASKRPVKLVYQELCDDISAAKKREAQVKSWPKEKKEALI